MPFKPEEVLFTPTTNCNLSCPHCVTKKSKNILSKKIAIRFLRECREYGIRRVGFTGGEPFLAPDFLFTLVREAVKENYLFDRIMTNGVWFKDRASLSKILQRLYKTGYDGSISVSVDVFHKQNIKKIAQFIETAVSIWKRKDNISIVYTTGYKDKKTEEKLKLLSRYLKARIIGFKGGHPCMKSRGIFIKLYKIEFSPIGKAGRLKGPWDGRWFKEDHCKGPGNVFFIMPDGRVKPCCGYANDLEELTIGNIKYDSPEDIINNMKRSKLVSTIFNSGLTTIRTRLEKEGHEFPGKTSNHCYFCYHIITDSLIQK